MNRCVEVHGPVKEMGNGALQVWIEDRSGLIPVERLIREARTEDGKLLMLEQRGFRAYPDTEYLVSASTDLKRVVPKEVIQVAREHFKLVRREKKQKKNGWLQLGL